MANRSEETGKGGPRWQPLAAVVPAFALTLAVWAIVDRYQRLGRDEAARAALIGELSRILATQESMINGNLLAGNGVDAEIAPTIIAMARKLRLNLVAEGVETEAQADFLVDQGCHAYQSYRFSRPLPAAAFADSLRARG